jgi:predicted ribosomally synthesized peptide with nif11-like leader
MTTRAESTKSGELLLQKLRIDSALRARVQATSTYAEFLEIARRDGFDLGGLSEGEARDLLSHAGPPLAELSEEDLGRVAGGAYDAYVQFKGQKQGKEAEVFVLTW